MNRNTVNIYLDGLMSLAEDKKAMRLPLIQEALSADNLIDLLQEWAWLQELRPDSALKLKIWFQLSYASLGKVLGIKAREVSQLLRNQRIQLLPGYRPETAPTAEFSCFMVEQHLSAWIDEEISDIKTIEAVSAHLKTCTECHHRLEQFRELQTLILSSRSKEIEIGEEEWNEAFRHFRIETKKRVFKFAIVATIIVATSAFLVWEIFSKPEKMPNVYEIQG